MPNQTPFPLNEASDEIKKPEPFMTSPRTPVVGEPYTQFHWIADPGDGKGPCIGKELVQPQGGPLNEMFANERQVLTSLNNKGAPVCEIVDYSNRSDWIVTRFAGLSLKLLGQDKEIWPGPITLQDRVAVWYWFLGNWDAQNRLATFLPLDVADRNIVVPVNTDDGTLHWKSPVLIDHALTVVSRVHRKIIKPVWINENAPHLPPEVCKLLRVGFDKWRQTGKYSEVIQPIQSAFDAGHISAGKVIQYSVGYALYQYLGKPDNDLKRRLTGVVKRLCQQNSSLRYTDFAEAQKALRQALNGDPALNGDKNYPPVVFEDLIFQSPNENQIRPLPIFDGVDADRATSAASVKVTPEANPEQVRNGFTTTLGKPPADANPSAPPTSPVVKPESPNVDESSQDPSPRTGPPRWIPAAVALALGQALGWPLGWWIASGG